MTLVEKWWAWRKRAFAHPTKLISLFVFPGRASRREPGIHRAAEWMV